jgi:tRNA G10  N-methylase Trm11
MDQVYWYFKLFNNIKSKDEICLAELELRSLFGEVSRVRNFTKILSDTPFGLFAGGTSRVEDMLAYELPYGMRQGFFAKSDEIGKISQLVKRLAYTREIFMVCEKSIAHSVLKEAFRLGEKDLNFQSFQNKDSTLFRFITNQYFLEKSQYVSRLSRNEKEASKNVKTLLSFLTKDSLRIPATETMQVGKRLQDYFAVREEPSLYLVHSMYPYKGKFHPKMARALLNYVLPTSRGKILDNFAGSGTLLVEATWMGLDSVGIEINPLSSLMSNVKCYSLSIPIRDLRKAKGDFLRKLRKWLANPCTQVTSPNLFSAPNQIKEVIEEKKKHLPSDFIPLFKDPKDIDRILMAYELVKKIKKKSLRYFFLLALSGVISDLTRRRNGEFMQVTQNRLMDLYLRIYIFRELNKTLKIKLGKSKTHTADARKMLMLRKETVDGIVNSPPYSTALDYVKNDYPQLVLLGLANIQELDVNTIGNPKFKIYPPSLLGEIENRSSKYVQLPEEAKKTISILGQYGRTKEAVRTFKFFKDMYLALEEMYRVLKKGSKCAIIIGNNLYKLDGRNAEVKNDDILKEMALRLGFKADNCVARKLEKTRMGWIRKESVLIFEKPFAHRASET